MKKKILLGLVAVLLAGAGGWAVLYMPMILESKACLGKDPGQGAEACRKLLTRKQYAAQDLGRATILLKQASHLLPLENEKREAFTPLVDAAEKILLATADNSQSAETSRKRELLSAQVILYRWVHHTLLNRQDLALQALEEGKKAFGYGGGETSAGKTLRSLLGCGALTAGNLAGSIENLAPLGFPRQDMALLSFLSGDDAGALKLAQNGASMASPSLDDMTSALALAVLGRNGESLKLLEGFLASQAAAQLPAKARGGLLAARGTLLRLSGDRRARADIDAALSLEPDAALRSYLLLERGKLSEETGQGMAALPDYAAVTSAPREQAAFAFISRADLLADIQPGQARALLVELARVRPEDPEILVLQAYLEWRAKRATKAKALLEQAGAASQRSYLRPAGCRKRLAAMARDKRLTKAAATVKQPLPGTKLPADMGHFRLAVGLPALSPLLERVKGTCRTMNDRTLARFSGKLDN